MLIIGLVSNHTCHKKRVYVSPLVIVSPHVAYDMYHVKFPRDSWRVRSTKVVRIGRAVDPWHRSLHHMHEREKENIRWCPEGRDARSPFLPLNLQKRDDPKTCKKYVYFFDYDLGHKFRMRWKDRRINDHKKFYHNNRTYKLSTIILLLHYKFSHV